MSEKLSMAELARRWGLSRERVRQYHREVDPMPLDGEEVALAWLSSHHPDRAAKIIQKQTAGKPAEPADLPAAGDVGDVGGDGVEVLLARARQIERSAWVAVEAAEKNRGEPAWSQAVLEARWKSHATCAAARQDMEERFIKYQLENRQCMRSADVLLFLGDLVGPILTQLDALPFSAGPRANPTDPSLAIGVLKEEGAKARRRIVDGLEQLKGGLGGAPS